MSANNKTRRNTAPSNLLSEIAEYKSVLHALIVRDLVGKYKNSLLGFSWHFIMPIVMLLVYYVIFTQVRINVIADFWVYLAVGIFPFNFLITNLNSGSTCIISNSNMIKKMYFPREIIVLSYVISSFIVMIIGYAIILAIILLFGYHLTFYVLFIPVILLLMLLFAIGLVAIISSIVVYVRDFHYFINSVSIVFYFITPLYFLIEDVNGLLETVVWINPFSYFIDSLHHFVYFGDCPDLSIIAMCVLLSLGMLLLGTLTFKKLKNGFVERL